MFRVTIFDGNTTYIFPINPSTVEFVPIQYQVEPFEDATGRLTPSISFSKKVGNLLIEGSWITEENYNFFKTLPEKITGKTVKLITHRKESYKVVLSESRFQLDQKIYSFNFIIFEETSALFNIKMGSVYNLPITYRVSGGVVEADYSVTLNANEIITFFFPNFVIGNVSINCSTGSIVGGNFQNFLQENPGGIQLVRLQAGATGARIVSLNFTAAPIGTEFDTFLEYGVTSIYPGQRLKEFYWDGSYERPRYWTPSVSTIGTTFRNASRTLEVYSANGRLTLLNAAGSSAFPLPPRTSNTTYELRIDFWRNSSAVSATFNIDWYNQNQQMVSNTFQLSPGLNRFQITIPLDILNNEIYSYFTFTGLSSTNVARINEVSLFQGRKTQEVNYLQCPAYTYLTDSETEAVRIEKTFGANPLPVYLYVGNHVPAYLVGDACFNNRTNGGGALPYTIVSVGTTELTYEHLSTLSHPLTTNPTSVSKTNYLVIAQTVTVPSTVKLYVRLKEGITTINEISATVPYSISPTTVLFEVGTVSITKDNLSVAVATSTGIVQLMALWLLPVSNTIKQTLRFPITIKRGEVVDADGLKYFLTSPVENGTVYGLVLGQSPQTTINERYLIRTVKNV